MNREQYFRKLLERISLAFDSGELVDRGPQDFEYDVGAALELPDSDSRALSDSRAEVAALRALVKDMREWLPQRTDIEDPDDVSDFAALRKRVRLALAGKAGGGTHG